MKGRKPKPERLLKLTGAYRPDRHKPSLDMSDTTNAQPPENLKSDEAETWAEFAPTLLRHGLLKVADAPLFEVFVREFARWRRLCRMVEDTGGEVLMIAGVPKANPALREAQRARDAVLKIATEFGMTPSARRNVKSSDGNNDLAGDLLRELKEAEG